MDSADSPGSLTPSQAYAAGAAAGRWQADPAQLALLPELDRIQRQLLAAEPEGALAKLAARLRGRTPVAGLYLWGSVGRGKTFLADLLYDACAGIGRQRWHFHAFMQQMHARMKALSGQADTLRLVARDLAEDMRLLVLDEFFVSDIGDAMILGRLLEQLIARGVTVVATSNTPPRELYRDGLQRASFLPAIDLIEKHCTVWRLDSAQDYRLRQLTSAPVYYSPLGETAERQLADCFARLSEGLTVSSAPLTINARAIAVREQVEAHGLVWFDFAELCGGPRSAADYVELAREFHTLLLSNVPRFDGSNEDAALRFVYLIDELYDRHVNLLLSAAADPLSLYCGVKVERQFERTSSRLIEMQSDAYLALEHRP
jgi:cell division protein ZapE